MSQYKLEKEDIQTYFKVLTRVTTITELETQRQALYKILFHDRVTAYRAADRERLNMYIQAEGDLVLAVLEIRSKIENTSTGVLSYKPKHRKKINVR